MSKSKEKKKSVEDYLNEVDYDFKGYIPKEASLKFILFMKLIENAKLSHNSPKTHLQLLDLLFTSTRKTAILCFRGFAKTTLLCVFFPLISAIKGKVEGFGEINYMLLILNSHKEGVKVVRNLMEATWENSSFLRKYLPEASFTDGLILLKNLDGIEMCINLIGVGQKIRGTAFRNKRGIHRPEVAIVDDVLDDVEAKSAVSIANVEDVIYKKIGKAVNLNHYKIIYIGTIFNSSDPLYKAVGTKQWKSVVFPICEKFPCTREEFRGAWEDKYSYDVVLENYNDSLELHRIQDFNQELMNRVMSDEDRLVSPSDIVWYDRNKVLAHKERFNFYITTDFAVSEKASADFSVISVWAYSYSGNWLWVDGILKRQLMTENMDDLFRLVQKYNPLSVGIEISGVQKGFISWIRSEMLNRNVIFNLASDENGGQDGIRPVKDKMTRFQLILPMFKSKKIWFPEVAKMTTPLIEALDELSKISSTGFKSKHDDFVDTISMLYVMGSWKPQQRITYPNFSELNFEDNRGLYNKGLSTIF